MAATAFEALIRTLSDASKVKMLRSGGIKIFDQEALKEGREILRPINELMFDIIKRTDGRKILLSEVLDAEAMRSFNSSITEFQRTGGLDSLDKFMSVQADGTQTMEDAARAAADAAGAMQNLYTAWQQFADSNLSQYIQSLADGINSVDKETLDLLIKAAAGLAVASGTAILERTGDKAGKGIYDFMKGGAKNGVGGAIGEMAGVQPVFVVNMPGGGLGGIGGGVKGARTPSRWQLLKSAPNMKSIGGMGAGAVGTAGLSVGAAGLAGYGAGSMIYDLSLIHIGRCRRIKRGRSRWFADH